MVAYGLKKVLFSLLLSSISLSLFAKEKFDEDKIIPQYHSHINRVTPKTVSFLSQYQIALQHFRIYYGSPLIRTDFFSAVEYFGKKNEFNISGSLSHTRDGEAFEYDPDISTSLVLSAGYTF